MNDLQNLFSVIAGIHYGLSLNAASVFAAFDTANAFAGDWRAWLRIGWAMLILNLLPFGYFVSIYRSLHSNYEAIGESWSLSFAALLAGLVFFGFYRIFAGVVLIPRLGNRTKDGRPCYAFYSDQGDYREDDPRHQRAQEVIQNLPTLAWHRHLVGGVAWTLFFFAGFAVLRWF